MSLTSYTAQPRKLDLCCNMMRQQRYCNRYISAASEMLHETRMRQKEFCDGCGDKDVLQTDAAACIKNARAPCNAAAKMLQYILLAASSNGDGHIVVSTLQNIVQSGSIGPRSDGTGNYFSRVTRSVRDGYLPLLALLNILLSICIACVENNEIINPSSLT